MENGRHRWTSPLDSPMSEVFPNRICEHSRLLCHRRIRERVAVARDTGQSLWSELLGSANMRRKSSCVLQTSLALPETIHRQDSAATHHALHTVLKVGQIQHAQPPRHI